MKYLILLALLAGCATKSVDTSPTHDSGPLVDAGEPTGSVIVDKPEERPALVLSWEVGHPERKSWTAKVEVLLKELMPKLDKAQDFEKLLGKKPADKYKAWGEVIVAVVKFESNYNPKTVYGEPPPLGYDSIGLLQLSYEDNAGYPFCKLSRAQKNLLDPLVNLNCGVRIMAQLIAKDGHISGSHLNAKGKTVYTGASAYWSTLRPKRKLPEVLAQVKKNL